MVNNRIESELGGRVCLRANTIQRSLLWRGVDSRLGPRRKYWSNQDPLTVFVCTSVTLSTQPYVGIYLKKVYLFNLHYLRKIYDWSYLTFKINFYSFCLQPYFCRCNLFFLVYPNFLHPGVDIVTLFGAGKNFFFANKNSQWLFFLFKFSYLREIYPKNFPLYPFFTKDKVLQHRLVAFQGPFLAHTTLLLIFKTCCYIIHSRNRFQ